MHCAEKVLLDSQRERMKAAVVEQVEQERDLLQASRMAAMRAEVDRAVSDERPRYTATRRELMHV